MCRNIKPLFNIVPDSTMEDCHNAAVQYVRKVSGFRKPSKINQEVFDKAVNEISESTCNLIKNLVTHAGPRKKP